MLRDPLPKYLAACLLVGAAIFLYLQVFILPGLPVLPTGDQTTWLLNARRMLAGQAIYRDFSQFLFPGTECIYLALFRLFGVRAWVPAAALVCVGVGFFWTSTLISRRLWAGASVFLPGFLFLAIPFRNAPMDRGSHHWYSALAVMAGLAVLIENRSPRRLALAGALCGASAWFNQTRGPFGLLGFALFLLWERYRAQKPWRRLLGRLVPLAIGFLVTAGALTSFFAWKAGLNRFFYSTFVFLLKYVPDYPSNGWSQYGMDMPMLHNAHALPRLGTWLVVELLVPWIYLVFFWWAWRHAPEDCFKSSAPVGSRPEPPVLLQECRGRLVLVSIVGFCLFLSVAPSAMNYRLCTVSLPAIILLVWFAQRLGKFQRVALPALWIGLLALMLAETISMQTRWHATLGLPIGRVAAFDPDDTEELQWMLSHQKPSDFLFASPEWNFPLGLPNPTPIDFLSRTDFTRPEQVQSIIAGLEAQRARWVGWEPELEIPDGRGDHLAPLRSYLHLHYHLAQSFADGEQILERNGP